MPSSTRYQFFDFRAIRELNQVERQVIIQNLMLFVESGVLRSQGIKNASLFCYALAASDDSVCICHSSHYKDGIDINYPTSVAAVEQNVYYRRLFRLTDGRMCVRLPYTATCSFMHLLKGIKRITLPFDPNVRVVGIPYSARPLLNDEFIALIQRVVL